MNSNAYMQQQMIPPPPFVQQQVQQQTLNSNPFVQQQQVYNGFVPQQINNYNISSSYVQQAQMNNMVFQNQNQYIYPHEY